MTNVKLKNATGEELTYEGVESVILQTAEGDTARFIQNGYLTKETEGVFKNIIDRASQLVNYEWESKATMMLQKNNLEFTIEPAGKSFQGFPYSSVKGIDNFIGINVLPETFQTALNNPRSVLYKKYVNPAGAIVENNVDDAEATRFITEITGSGITDNTISAGNYNPFKAIVLTKSGDGAVLPTTFTADNYKVLSNSYNKNSCLYYGIVCSVLGKHGFDLPTYETTYSWDTSFENKFKFIRVVDETTFDIPDDCKFLRVGDVVMTITPSTGGGHFTIVSKIEKDSNGEITNISILESTDPLAVEQTYTKSYFYTYFITSSTNNYQRVYRFIGEIPEEDESFTLLNNYDFNNTFAIDKGNKSHYRCSLNGLTGEDFIEPITVNNLTEEKLTLYLFDENNNRINITTNSGIEWEVPTDSSKYAAISASNGAVVDSSNKCITTKLIKLPTDNYEKPMSAFYTLDTGAEGYVRIARVALYDENGNHLPNSNGGLFYDVGNIAAGKLGAGEFNEKTIDIQGAVYARFCIITASDSLSTSSVTVTSARMTIDGVEVENNNISSSFEVEANSDFIFTPETKGIYKISSTTNANEMTTSNTQEFYYYDTGNIVFDEIATNTDVVKMSGTLRDWMDDMTPAYVSINTMSGVVLKTAAVTEINSDKTATFSISLDKTQLAENTQNNNARLFFKAHYNHKFGMCVTPMMYEK